LAATTAISALQLLKLNRYCGQAEAIHLDEKGWSVPDKCWNQRLDATVIEAVALELVTLMCARGQKAQLSLKLAQNRPKSANYKKLKCCYLTAGKGI
jgi:hypothetical protein